MNDNTNSASGASSTNNDNFGVPDETNVAGESSGVHETPDSKPTVIEHIERFGDWTIDEVKEAYDYFAKIIAAI